LPAARHVETATFVFGAVKPQGSDQQADALVFAGTQGPLGTRLVSGREADPNRPNEFLASKSFATSLGLKLGAHLDLVTLTQHQADVSGFNVPAPQGPSLTGVLVGVIDGPDPLSDGYQVVLFPRSLS
jgi:hypothetical protein